MTPLHGWGMGAQRQRSQTMSELAVAQQQQHDESAELARRIGVLRVHVVGAVFEPPRPEPHGPSPPCLPVPDGTRAPQYHDIVCAVFCLLLLQTSAGADNI